MKEGTKSVLFGCHNPIIHGLCVLRAWKQEYGSWPEWWQVIGIFLHDIGVWGRPYLSDDEAKKGHWKKGAWQSAFLVSWICRKVFGSQRINSKESFDVWLFCAGHCPEESGWPQSKLARADKRSWLVAPMWWLWCNYYIEWHGKGIGVTPPPVWRKLVAENLKREKPLGNHELYIRNRK